MSEHYLVVRENDAEKPEGAIHVSQFSQEGPARADAENKARDMPGVRYAIYRRMDVCEASITPASWDSDD